MVPWGPAARASRPAYNGVAARTWPRDSRLARSRARTGERTARVLAGYSTGTATDHDRIAAPRQARPSLVRRTWPPSSTSSQSTAHGEFVRRLEATRPVGGTKGLDVARAAPVCRGRWRWPTPETGVLGSGRPGIRTISATASYEMPTRGSPTGTGRLEPAAKLLLPFFLVGGSIAAWLLGRIFGEGEEDDKADDE